MTVTPEDQLWSPDRGELDKPSAYTSAMQDSVQAALLSVRRRSGMFDVSNIAQRDALFPTPSQGDSVFRTDLGVKETYYKTYDPTANPGGANVAGWYLETDIRRSAVLASVPSGTTWDVTIERVGKRVFAEGKATTVSQFLQGSIEGVLPVDFRPARSEVFLSTPMLTSGFTWIPGMAYILSDGGIRVNQSGIEGIKYIGFNGFWRTA